jgi:arylsulfatase A-like enzyme
MGQGSLLFVFLVVVGTVQFLGGCSWRSNEKPSFLIIAVEGLNSESIDCANLDEDFEKGLGVLCAEGVRFTHAYTPSTQSQATLASILTGLYPKSHGVWHNGNTFLSENTMSVARVAVSKGYRTAFFREVRPFGENQAWRKASKFSTTMFRFRSQTFIAPREKIQNSF